MKTLHEFLLEVETIWDLTSRDFAKVWKGKKLNLPLFPYNLLEEDFEYIINKIFAVHRKELPTAEEFENACNFVTDKFSKLPISEIEEKFLHKFVEFFFTKSKTYKFPVHNIVFYGQKYMRDSDNDSKIIYGKQLQEVADAWGLDVKDFPDYSDAVEKIGKQ